MENLIQQSDDGRPSAKDMVAMYRQAQQMRAIHEPDWRMNAAFCMPSHYSSWGGEGMEAGTPDKSVKRYAYDATAARALPKWVAILRRLTVPDGHRWGKLQASDPTLRKAYRVRVYFDELNDVLFRLRYAPNALFGETADEMFVGLGIYGTGPVRMRWRKPKPVDRDGGLGYRAMSMANMYFLQDPDGHIRTGFAREYMNVRQFRAEFPGVVPPKSLRAEMFKPAPDETRKFELVHVVMPRSEASYKPGSLGPNRHPYAGYWFSAEDQEYFGQEGGYASFPYLVPRTARAPGALYGYSPASQSSPATGSVNAMKRTLLRQGQKAVDPTLLAADDGVISGRVGLTPGYINFGGLSPTGQERIKALAPGNFTPAIELMQDERNDINDAFLVTLFQILIETPEMTATEVIERVAEKAALAAPTMARLQGGFLGPEVARALDLIAENRPSLLPKPPPELIEARGEYEVLYTSPLAKGLHAEEDAGFLRVSEAALNVAGATKDPEPLDHFNWDVAIPEMADHQSVPTRWMNPPEVVAQKRQQRQAMAEAQMATDALPGIAQVANATTKQNAQG